MNRNQSTKKLTDTNAPDEAVEVSSSDSVKVPAKPGAGSTVESIDATIGVDATIGFEGATPTSRSKSASFTATKQYRDLAFATTLLRSGKLSERHLVRAMLNWTTHGAATLGDHLVTEGFLTVESRDEIESTCQRELERIADDLSLHGQLTYEIENQFWMEQIDRSGKVSKLLGIADDSMLSPTDRQFRRVGARYTLLRKLGQGGLGTVWLARDENLRRYVAVKEITNQLGEDDQARAHFRREAEITGRLEHPGIVPIYQFGTDEESGRGFYAMRFLGKRTLQDALVEYHERRDSGKKESLMMHRMLTAFVNICQAVAHAHSRNVIHRDLKPENVALNSFGQVVLLDWGLAKINDDTGMYDVDGDLEPGDLHNVGKTLAGRVLGTPLYMAPEQAAGRLEEVDHLTDVYGLGGILFAILTGVAPHEHAFESAGSKSGSDVFSTILSRDTRTPRELVSDVPPELDAICRKALQPKRYLRYESASALAEDIQRYMAGESVTAYEAPWQSRVRRWMGRHPTASQLLLLMTSLLLIGGAAIVWTAQQGKRALLEARYAGLVDITREIEANLRFDTRELAQDVNFVTELPLMQAVIASRKPADELVQEQAASDAPSSGPQIARSISDVREVSPDEWIERQGGLIDGLLRANPAYLVMGTYEIGPKITELVRSERMAPGSMPYRVPRPQLLSIEPQVVQDEKLSAFRPGRVTLTTGDQLEENLPSQNRSALNLAAVSPVFDASTGSLYGVNVIEMDLRERLTEMLRAVVPNDVTVYITDVNGNEVLRFQDGETANFLGDRSIVDRFPDLRDFFRSGQNEFNGHRQLYARLVPLCNEVDCKAVIGVVVELSKR